MKIKITYTTDPINEIVDLTDFGYTPETQWGDLTVQEQETIWKACLATVKVRLKDITLVNYKK